jgi:hypothetical protein
MAGFLLSIAGSCALLQNAPAQFVDTNRDLILTFRQTGFDQSGITSGYDLEVDIGQASKYYGATWGSSIPITAYATSQLNTLFSSDLNDLSWSVGSCVDSYGDTGDPSIPDATLWVTAPRINPNVPPAAWLCKDWYSQTATCSPIESIMDNDNTYASLLVLTGSSAIVNTTTALDIPANTTYAPDAQLSAVGNYAGTFQGDVENTTPTNFTTAGLPSRSDFYELQPSAGLHGGPGAYLGYFEFDANGSMTFYAQYTQPTLTISTDGVNVYVSFPTTPGGIYTLYYTGAAGLATPVSTWSKAVTTITGNGSTQTFQQPISGAGTFYSVGVQHP